MSVLRGDLVGERTRVRRGRRPPGRTTRDPVLPQIRQAVIRRDHGQCRYCGCFPDPEMIEIDHVVPVIHLGPTIMRNLVTSCRSCNRRKSTSVWVPNDIIEPDTPRKNPLVVRTPAREVALAARAMRGKSSRLS